MERRYNDFSSYLRGIFGCRVQKITIDAGLTCPNRDGTVSTGGCIYCNTKGSGTGAHSAGISITDQIVKAKAAIVRRYKAKKFIAYFQSFSNTYAPLATLRRLYDEALAIEGVVGLSIGTRPDCVDPSILDLLETYAESRMVWVEYGLQSAHNATLEFINRGHNFECFQGAVEATRNRGIKICAHVILGLPHETRKQMLETADRLAELEIDGIKLHLLYVIKGTRLDELYTLGKYRCLEQEEYVNIVCDFLERTPDRVVIQRLTGDPHPAELVAPQWSLKKAETLAMIDNIMQKRNTRQGQLLS
jgi:radical SAM protein (TIGR01212 family)